MAEDGNYLYSCSRRVNAKICGGVPTKPICIPSVMSIGTIVIELHKFNKKKKKKMDKMGKIVLDVTQT